MNKLNPKQAEVVKRVVKGQSQTQAYKDVYGVTDDNVAAASSSKLLRKDKVQNELQKALHRKGLDEDAIADTLLEMRNNRDWRAKESAVDRIAKFHGYSDDKPNLTQVNIGGEMGVKISTYDPDRITQEPEGRI